MKITRIKNALTTVSLALSRENSYGLTPIIKRIRMAIHRLLVMLGLRPTNKQPYKHIFVTHHKTGHHLCANIAQAYSRRLLLNYYDLSVTSEIPRDADVIVYESDRRLNHSGEYKFASYGGDLGIQNINFRGVHVIRHPYEIIASGYRWHKKIDRPWVKEEWKGTGKSYQELLNSGDGLAFEMRNVSKDVIMNIYNFPFSDTRFLTIKLEDFLENYEHTIACIAQHLGIPKKILLKTSAPFNLNTMSKYPKYVTRKKLDQPSYIELLEPHHYDLFREIFPPDLLSKLGYD